MSESTLHKTQNSEILKRLDEHRDMLTALSLTMQLFIQKQESINVDVKERVDIIWKDAYGNDKKGWKEMVTRLWEDKVTSKTIYIAIAICILTALFSVIIK